MLKSILRISLCGGVVLSTFPTLSMDKTGSEAPDSRKRAISVPSADKGFMKQLKVAQAATQKEINITQEVKAAGLYNLTSTQLATILYAPHKTEDRHIDTLGRMDSEGRISTDAVVVNPAFPHILASAKLGEQGLKSLKKAMHPDYASTQGAPQLQIKDVFEALPVPKAAVDEKTGKSSVDPKMTAKIVDVKDTDYRGATASSNPGSKSELLTFRIFCGGVTLQFPQLTEMSGSAWKMRDAVLELSFTVLQSTEKSPISLPPSLEKKEEKEEKGGEGLPSSSVRPAVIKLVPPTETLPPAPTSQSKGKSPARLKSPSVGSREKPAASTSGSSRKPAPKGDRAKASLAPLSIPPSVRRTSTPDVPLTPDVAPTPKASFMTGLKAAQVQTQQVVKAEKEAPESLIASQISLILQSPQGVSIDKNISVSVRNDVAVLQKAVCKAYVEGWPFDILRDDQVAVIYPHLVAEAEEFDLQSNYGGPTVTGKIKKGIPSTGTLKKYVLKKELGGDPIKYPNPLVPDQMITAYIELSVTVEQ